MTKIGRNDQCPCGSGKKYKKCCGAVERPKYASDVVTAQIQEMYVANANEIGQKFQQASRELATMRNDLLAGGLMAAAEAEERLEAYASELERSVRAVVARSSPIFWLSLERRFPPWLHLGYCDALPGHEMQLLRESRQVETALFLKHGTWDKPDWEPASDFTLQIVPNVADVVDLWGYLQPYFIELSNLSILYRRVGKGAHLTLDKRTAPSGA